MEKKFWLVGLGIWLVIQIPIGFTPLLFLIFTLLEEASIGFVIGVLLGTFVQIVVISWVCSWLWTKWKRKRIREKGEIAWRSCFGGRQN